MDGECTSIELLLFALSPIILCRDDRKQLTFINETEARAVSCDVIMVTSHCESSGSILGHFPTFATPSLYINDLISASPIAQWGTFYIEVLHPV